MNHLCTGFRYLTFLLLLIFQVNTNADNSFCSVGTTPEFEKLKELVPQVKEAKGIQAYVKQDLISRYEQSKAMDKSIVEGTNPICMEIAQFNREFDSHESAVSAFNSDAAAFAGQCGGTVSQAQYQRCVDWRSNLLTMQGKLNDSKVYLDNKSASLNSKVERLNEQNKSFDTRLVEDMQRALGTRTWSEGHWVRGVSVANVLGGCFTSWTCHPPSSIMRSTDSQLLATQSERTRGTCQATKGDPESCGSCLSYEPAESCKYCVQPAECSNAALGWRTKEQMGCCPSK